MLPCSEPGWRTEPRWRSAFERFLGGQLRLAAVPFLYEPFRLPYLPGQRTYTPDILLPNGILVEAKGRFTPEDRSKHKLLRAQHPELDIRIVFQRATVKLNPGSKTTYGAWCSRHGIPWAERRIPPAWLAEPGSPDEVLARWTVKKQNT